MKCTKYKCCSDMEAEFDARPIDPNNSNAVAIAKLWCGICKWCKEEYELVGMVGGIQFVPIKKVKDDWVTKSESCFNCRYHSSLEHEIDCFEPPRKTCKKHNWKVWMHEVCPDFTSSNVISIEREKPC